MVFGIVKWEKSGKEHAVRSRTIFHSAKLLGPTFFSSSPFIGDWIGKWVQNPWRDTSAAFSHSLEEIMKVLSQSGAEKVELIRSRLNLERPHSFVWSKIQMVFPASCPVNPRAGKRKWLEDVDLNTFTSTQGQHTNDCRLSLDGWLTFGTVFVRFSKKRHSNFWNT